MSLARSYARALFDTVSETKKDGAEPVAIAEAQLRQISDLLKSSKEVRFALVSPLTSSEEKDKILVDLCNKLGIDQSLQKFLRLVAAKGRFGQLENIADDFSALRVELSGGVIGSIVSADPLSDAELSDLQSSFAKKLGKTVVFHTQVDPDLIAGLQVTVGGVTYDGTIRSQLKRLKDKFIEG